MYKNDYLELTNEDNMELMKRYPDNYFELAIVDPPYGIGADKAQNNAAQQRLNANGKTKAGRGYKMYKKTDWDNVKPFEKYWSELFRVSKNQIVWGGGITLLIFWMKKWDGLFGTKCSENFHWQMGN